MIRVNLVNAQRMTASAGGASGGADGADGYIPISDEELKKQAMTRILIMCLFPAALFAWELQAVPAKKAELESKRAHLTQLAEQNAASKKTVEEIKSFETQQKKIQSQINVLEKLKKGRLQEVKVLEFIQRSAPTKVWLHKIEFNENRVTIEGFALTPAIQNTFIETLSQSIFLKDVNVGDSKEEQDKTVQLDGTHFIITAGVEALQ